jgi:hypothetical protein
MPQIIGDPPSRSCYHLFPGQGIQESQQLGPDVSRPRARDGRGRFTNGSSGNPRGRPPGIPNPRRHVRSPGHDRGIAARPLKGKALSDLLERKPYLLRALIKQLLPRPPSFDPAACLSIELESLRTAEDCRQVLSTVLEAVAQGEIAPAEAARIARRVRTRLRAIRRLARFASRLATAGRPRRSSIAQDRGALVHSGSDNGAGVASNSGNTIVLHPSE